MKKKELLILIVLFVASTLYSFQVPDETVETISSVKSITVQVDGVVSQNLTFDDIPTIHDVFLQLQLDNHYGFDDTYVLQDQSYFYIPVTTEGVSLNQATLEELTTIQGIGEKTALKIIDYRQQTPFYTIEDIMNISGIGEKTYLKMREFLCL